MTDPNFGVTLLKYRTTILHDIALTIAMKERTMYFLHSQGRIISSHTIALFPSLKGDFLVIALPTCATSEQIEDMFIKLVEASHKPSKFVFKGYDNPL